MKAFLSFPFLALIFSTFFTLNPASAQEQYSQIPLQIERYTSTAGEVNVRPYIKNVEHYTGFRLVGIEVVAGALNESATVTVYVNGKQQGPDLQLGQIVFPNRVFMTSGFFMGFGAEEILIRTQNPTYIKSVNLLLGL